MIPACGVVVVTYNSAAELPACLDSLFAQEGVRCEIVVVDNASRDGSADLARARGPRVDVVENERNEGFARAVNRGLDRLGPDCAIAVLVNPDTIASPGVLAACAAVLEARPEVAVVAPRLVHPDGSLHPSCHGFMNLANLLGEALMVDRLWPRSRFGALHRRDFAHDRACDVDWIQGAFLVARREAIAKVGALDPAFFMYGEEMDWMRRLSAAGYRTTFLPGPTVVHLGGASSRPIAGPMFVELLKSRLRYVAKHHGAVAAAVAKPVLALGILPRLVGWEVAGAWVARRSQAHRELVRLRRAMYRSALAWMARGFPLDPPRLAGTG